MSSSNEHTAGHLSTRVLHARAQASALDAHQQITGTRTDNKRRAAAAPEVLCAHIQVGDASKGEAQKPEPPLLGGLDDREHIKRLRTMLMSQLLAGCWLCVSQAQQSGCPTVTSTTSSLA